MGRIVRRLVLTLLAVTGAAAAAGSAAWWLSPTFRESVYLAALASGADPIQGLAAEGLREVPTERAAIALVAFVNLKYRPPVDLRWFEEAFADPEAAREEHVTQLATLLEQHGCLLPGEGPKGFRMLAEVDRRAARTCLEEALEAAEPGRERANRVAEEGMQTLCILTGHAFGTYYEANEWGGHTWGSLSDDVFSTALGELNGWAFDIFGPEVAKHAVGELATAFQAFASEIEAEEVAP